MFWGLIGDVAIVQKPAPSEADKDMNNCIGDPEPIAFSAVLTHAASQTWS